MTRCLVTGGAGFIGSHVAEWLVRRGHEVLVVDNLSGGFAANVPEGAAFEFADVCEPLDDVFAGFGPEVVYHLAAYAAEGLSPHIAAWNYRVNLEATANVWNACHRADVDHLVFTSSMAVYGHPDPKRYSVLGDPHPFDEEYECLPCDPYGIAKLAAEQHLVRMQHYFGRPAYTIFRPHNVFGERQNLVDPYRNVVGIFVRRALAGEPLPIFGDGEQTRSFSYVGPTAAAIAAAPFTPGTEGRTFCVGGDEPMSILDLAKLVSKVVGVPLSIEWRAPRQEVRHAHCRNTLARRTFPEAYSEQPCLDVGMRWMVAWARSLPAMPPPTPCPAPIEIEERLPAAWAKSA